MSITVFFISNALATSYVLASLVMLGAKMPRDLALLGFDDFDLADLTSPSLTVVRQPALEMDRVAASLLLERIARGELPQTGNRIVLLVEIVLRRILFGSLASGRYLRSRLSTNSHQRRDETVRRSSLRLKVN